MTHLEKWMVASLPVAIFTAMPAFGHHSFAMFDQKIETRLKVMTVARFQWTNSHVFAIAANGSTTYLLECSSPNLMSHQGGKHNTLAPGAKVDVVFYPLRNGKAGGMLKNMILPDGKSIGAW